ncbi:MAG: transposase [Frankiaceae bacterium]
MPETRRKFDPEFREGAVRIVRETGKLVAQVARDLGINEGTLGNWCARHRAKADHSDGLSGDERVASSPPIGGELRPGRIPASRFRRVSARLR